MELRKNSVLTLHQRRISFWVNLILPNAISDQANHQMCPFYSDDIAAIFVHPMTIQIGGSNEIAVSSGPHQQPITNLKELLQWLSNAESSYQTNLNQTKLLPPPNLTKCYLA